MVLVGLMFTNFFAHAQQNLPSGKKHLIDSLKKELGLKKQESSRSKDLIALSIAYAWNNADSAMTYAEENMLLANKDGSPLAEAVGRIIMADVLIVKGNYSQALNYALRANELAEKLNEKATSLNVYWSLSDIYKDAGDYDNAIHYAKLAVTKSSKGSIELLVSTQDLAEVYERFNKLDSALVYTKQAYLIDSLIAGNLSVGDIALIYGNIYYKKRDFPMALNYYYKGIPLAENQEIYKDLIDIYIGIAKTQLALKKTDSSIYYAREATALGNYTAYPLGVLNATNLLANIFRVENNKDSLIRYMDMTSAIKDSIFNQEKIAEVENLSFNEKLRQDELIRARKAAQERIAKFSLLGGLIFLLVIAVLLYKNNLNKQKAFALLQKQKNETEAQKAIAEKTLSELKNTQAQLIHSEKMASLGELTAGIAHEIENPLNFVNNFSELNLELIDEVKSELDRTQISKANLLLQDIQQYLEKIVDHGKKADLIVKGMLQHSRTSTGKKEPGDINALIEEWLRLSYHGMRARNKRFECNTKTELDSAVGFLDVVPQDIGLVFQNLFTNAFYSVYEKMNKLNGSYRPELLVQTKRLSNDVIVTVRDNGMCISPKNKDKIFQPFFTTKPRGQGTGLGLSIIYDIISKEHGGSIKVESEEGQFAEFIIKLPLKQTA